MKLLTIKLFFLLVSSGIAVIFLLPTKIHATTLVSGDLIKGSSPTVYYYAPDEKRYLFPNQEVFFSWYSDFKNIKKISDKELANIPFSGRSVTFRAGSVLLKTANDSKVYFLEPGGILRWVSNAGLANKLWGSEWPKLVKDIPETLLENYTIGEPIKENKFPSGSIITDEDGANYYINSKGEKQKITGEAVEKNRFEKHFRGSRKKRFLKVYKDGAEINVENKELTDIFYSGSLSKQSSNLGTRLTVSLSEDNPGDGFLYLNKNRTSGVEALTDFGHFNFTAGNDGDISIQKIVFTLSGTMTSEKLSSFYLFLDQTEIAQVGISGKTTTISFENNNELFRVTKGSSKNIVIRGDVLSAIEASKTLQISIASQEAITSNQNPFLDGVFPLVGQKKLTEEIQILGKILVRSVSEPERTILGETKKEVWRLEFESKDRDIALEGIRLKLDGSMKKEDIKNFRLFYNKNQIGPTIEFMDENGMLWFNLKDSPFIVPQSQSRSLSLLADIVGGVDREFSFSLRRGSDIIAKDLFYKVYLRPNSADTFVPIKSEKSSKITLGDVEVISQKHTTKNILSLNESQMEFARFTIKPKGEDLKLTSLTITPTLKNGNDAQANSNPPSAIGGFRLILNDRQIKDTLTLNNNTPLTLSFQNEFVLPKDTNSSLKILADVFSPSGNAFDVNDTIEISFEEIKAEGIESHAYAKVPNFYTGLLTIKEEVFRARASNELSDKNLSSPTGKSSEENFLIGKFTLTAGPVYNVEFTQIVLKDNGSEIWNNEFESVFLSSGGKDPKNTKNSIAPKNTSFSSFSSSYVFQLNSAIKINKGKSYTFDVYASKLLSGATLQKEYVATFLKSVTYNEIVSSKDVRSQSFTDEISGQKIYFTK